MTESSYLGALLPDKVMAKPHEWFHFNSEGELRFRSRQAPLYGEELQPRKFLVPRQDASYANPYGFPDLSMCFWPTVFKRGGLKFWVKFGEKFGEGYANFLSVGIGPPQGVVSEH